MTKDFSSYKIKWWFWRRYRFYKFYTVVEEYIYLHNILYIVYRLESQPFIKIQIGFYSLDSKFF